MAFVLYLHRVALGEIVKFDTFVSDMNVGRQEIGRVLGAFFFTYAAFQIPAGWFADRWGGRQMLTLYIALWSLTTGLSGLVGSAIGLLIVRLACGAAQAGAYPTSGAIIRRWFPPENRGLASGMVSMGGRIGGALTPLVTTYLVLWTGSWRIALFILSLLGFLAAAVYWLVVRDRPALHNRTNQAERILSGVDERESVTRASDVPRMLSSCITSRSIWIVAFFQFSTNVGWIFLITWLPTYLKDKGAAENVGALMSSLILGAGIVGQLLGGYFGDWSVRRLGRRWGRVFPMATASLVAAAAYLLCIGLNDVWSVVLCCATVSLMSDLGNPSFWAFAQDVGGKNTASVLGFCNMMGNLGAALSAMLIPYLMKWGSQTGQAATPIFTLFSMAYLACAIAVLFINATKPLSD
jgi:nitrate/nitrite transporter NarK